MEGTPSLLFSITTKINMKVYLYGGSSRLDAIKMVVDGNEQPETRKVYSIKKDEGMFLVAYPDEEEQ